MHSAVEHMDLASLLFGLWGLVIVQAWPRLVLHSLPGILFDYTSTRHFWVFPTGGVETEWWAGYVTLGCAYSHNRFLHLLLEATLMTLTLHVIRLHQHQTLAMYIWTHKVFPGCCISLHPREAMISGSVNSSPQIVGPHSCETKLHEE